MEAHENPAMTAKREVKEETNLDVELVDLIGIYSIDRGDNATGIGFVFRGKIIEGEIGYNREEIQKGKYFTPQEIQNLIESGLIYKPEYNLPAISDWLDGKSYPLEVIRVLS